MRILFDQVVYDMRNKGNIALTQVALQRVHRLWPDASLEVMTEAPHLLRLYCPESFPVSVSDSSNWSINREKFESFHRRVPQFAIRLMFEVREELKYRGIFPDQIRARLRSRFSKSDSFQNRDYKNLSWMDSELH